MYGEVPEKHEHDSVGQHDGPKEEAARRLAARRTDGHATIEERIARGQCLVSYADQKRPRHRNKRQQSGKQWE